MKALFILGVLIMSGFCHAQTWLSMPAATGYVDIGDLDISGNQLTVEALYTSTNPSSVDLVSKHSAPPDVNYLLRQTHAEMTTTNGFNFTPQVCPADQNTCRHAAMVYDGVNLKFYLNGQLNGQVPFAGNLAQNNFETLIGNYGCCFGGEQFFGFIDEVRIWNIARTQAQIQAFMFSSLPTPTTQTGLQAYYSFNSTINLQGNPAWDGFAAGTASIGNVNPFCGALSPVCAILGGNFGRFTATALNDGLQLDWTWNGEAPQYFELEAGPNSQSLTVIDRIHSNESSAWRAAKPTSPTWFRLSATDHNGEATQSNIVEFVPAAAETGLRLLPRGNHVTVVVPRPMEVNWRLLDALGHTLTFGHACTEADFDIPLPEELHRIYLLEAIGDGVVKVAKCIRP